MKHDEH